MLKFWLWLTNVPGLTNQTRLALLHHFGTPEDIFYAYIAGMDAFALGLRLADKMIRDGRIDSFVQNRYASYESGIGKRISDGTATMAELEEYALSMGDVTTNQSGRQEYLENVLNGIFFAR